MPIYHQLGDIPKKRHTTFRKKDGTLHHEELFGTIGFDGMSSLLYHLRRPTMVKQVNEAIDFRPKVSVSHNIISRKLTGFDISPENDFLEARKPLMVNQDIVIGMMASTGSLKDYFYKNTDADELLFIHKGSGILQTFLGNIAFGKGDYLLVPRGVIYQIHFDNTDNKIFPVIAGYHCSREGAKGYRIPILFGSKFISAKSDIFTCFHYVLLPRFHRRIEVDGS